MLSNVFLWVNIDLLSILVLFSWILIGFYLVLLLRYIKFVEGKFK